MISPSARTPSRKATFLWYPKQSGRNRATLATVALYLVLLFGFSRTAYGLVKIRTDGHRFFVYTDSGKVKMKEAYAYQLDSSGVPQPAEVKRA